VQGLELAARIVVQEGFHALFCNGLGEGHEGIFIGGEQIVPNGRGAVFVYDLQGPPRTMFEAIDVTLTVTPSRLTVRDRGETMMVGSLSGTMVSFDPGIAGNRQGAMPFRVIDAP
jgi:hypothetical protein